jgi:hypothetical protein
MDGKTDHLHGATAPRDHLLHLYREQGQLLDTLEGFIAAGLDDGDSVIVIATAPHLHALESRLQARKFDLKGARNENRYLPFGADDAMDRFMVDGRPDPRRFAAFLEPLLARARGPGRKVRGFGEMVAVLWGRGRREAALELEQLWSPVCARGSLTLLCAYPEYVFGRHDGDALARVRASHSGELAG